MNNPRSEQRLFELLVETANSYIQLPYEALDSTIAHSLKELGEFIAADRFYIFSYDFEKQTASITHEWCNTGIRPQINELIGIPMSLVPDWIDAHNKGETVHISNVNDLAEHSHLRQLLEKQGTKNLVSVPMMDGATCLGFLGFDSTNPVQQYAEQEITLLNVFSKMLVNVRSRYISQQKAEQELIDSRYAINERLKELNCMYSISRLNERQDLSIAEYLQEVAELIPLGFEFSHSTSACLHFDGVSYKNHGFSETEQHLTTEILVHDIQRGYIKIFTDPASQFLDEEVDLLDAIRRTIGQQMERLEAERTRKASEDRLNNLLMSQTNYVIRTDMEGRHTYWNANFEHDFGWIYQTDELSGTDSLKSICEYDHEKTLATVMECMSEPGKVVKVELDKPSNRGIVTTLWEFVCLTDSNGVPIEMQCMGIDITERRGMEKQLLASEHKYRSLFNDSPDGYLIIKDGRFIECNHASERMMGGTREQILGIPPDRISPEFQPNGRRSDEYAAELLAETISYGNHTFEWVHSRFDGEDFIALINLSVIEYDGEPAIFTTWRDITEAKRSQENVVKFRTIIEQSNYGSAIADLQGLLIYVNPAFAAMHGYRVDEMLGMSLTRLHHEKHLPYVLGMVGKIQTEGGFSMEEVPHMRKDGGLFPTFMSAKLIFDGHGRPSYMSATVIDITEKKAQEREIVKLKLAIEQSPVAIVITDLDANIEYTSPAFTEITGFSVDDVIGENCRMLRSGETEVDVYKEMWDTIQAGDVWQGEWKNRKKNGELYWESISITPVLNDDGEISNYLAIKQDISERKRAELEILDLNTNLEEKIAIRTVELDAARIEAEKANAAKSEFLSRMSHELRTPMNSILGFAQLLEMGQISATQLKSVTHILRSGKHLLQLINEVLDISRIEAGRISLSLEPVELRGLYNELIDSVSPYALSRSIAMECTMDVPEIHVLADRQRLKQVMINLINNAIKYNHDGGSVRVSATLRQADAKGNVMVRLCVTDTGIGIHENDIPKLFTPFERIGAERSETEGTGLGLTVVKKLVAVMDGLVGMESTLGQGSTFWVELPYCQSPLRNAYQNGDLEHTQIISETSGGTILYIEDNVSNIELVEQILLTSRPNIRLVTNMYGKQTVQLAIQNKPILILLDLNLPDMHGADVLSALKATPETASIPVLIISADAMPRQLENMRLSGAEGYLTKPLEIPLFLEEIDRYIRRP
jgi:PAS domain S-box-containing protein